MRSSSTLEMNNKLRTLRRAYAQRQNWIDYQDGGQETIIKESKSRRGGHFSASPSSPPLLLLHLGSIGILPAKCLG